MFGANEKLPVLLARPRAASPQQPSGQTVKYMPLEHVDLWCARRHLREAFLLGNGTGDLDTLLRCGQRESDRCSHTTISLSDTSRQVYKG